jgi:hypothetical protein
MIKQSGVGTLNKRYRVREQHSYNTDDGTGARGKSRWQQQRCIVINNQSKFQVETKIYNKY